jgi:hypothetical protein
VEPRGARHGAFVHGEHTFEAIAERRKSAALNETATELLFEAFRAQTDIAVKLRGGLLRPEEAEAQREAIKAQVAVALTIRERAAEPCYQIASTRPGFSSGTVKNGPSAQTPNLSLTWQIEKQIGLSFLIVIECHVGFLGRELELADTGKCYV